MGEVHDLKDHRQTIQEALEAENAELHRQLAGAETENRAWRTRYANLKADRQAEAEEDPNWPLALRLFKYHNRVFGHERCRWSAARFRMVESLLREPDGLERGLRAIAGHRRDAWSIQRKRTLFDHVFESQKALEGALLRCPKNWKPPPGYDRS